MSIIADSDDNLQKGIRPYFDPLALSRQFSYANETNLKFGISNEEYHQKRNFVIKLRIMSASLIFYNYSMFFIIMLYFLFVKH